MSKPLSSYPEHERRAVIKRRLAGNQRGLGYLSALDAAWKLKIAVPSEKKSYYLRGDEEDE